MIRFIVLAVMLSGCLVVTVDGEPPAQGVWYTCSFTMNGVPREEKVCGELGDATSAIDAIPDKAVRGAVHCVEGYQPCLIDHAE